MYIIVELFKEEMGSIEGRFKKFKIKKISFLFCFWIRYEYGVYLNIGY